MVDLETMGTTPSAAIVSLGAVAFERGGTSVPRVSNFALRTAPGFYQNVNLQSCIDLGLEIDGDTVMWWLARDSAARGALKEPVPKPIDEVMANFLSWAGQFVNGRTGSIWSHGADFDIPIIKTIQVRLCRRYPERADKFKVPWAWWNGEHTRSIYNEAGVKLPRADTRTGGHNAFEDAVLQAEHVQQAFRILRARRGAAGDKAGLGSRMLAAVGTELEESDL